MRPCHLIIVAVQHRGGPDGVAAPAATSATAAAAMASGVVGVCEGDRVSRQLGQSNGAVGRASDEQPWLGLGLGVRVRVRD